MLQPNIQSFSVVQYYATTTLYYKITQYYNVPPRITIYYSSTTLYYKILHQDYL